VWQVLWTIVAIGWTGFQVGGELTRLNNVGRSAGCVYAFVCDRDQNTTCAPSNVVQAREFSAHLKTKLCLKRVWQFWCCGLSPSLTGLASR
jgi:hypothetical protein